VLIIRTDAEIADIVHEQIRRVLVDRFGQAKPFSGQDRLNGTLGLSSLDLAELVVALEDTFGADPFAKLVPITDMRTVDDLVRAYRAALLSEPADPDELDQELTAARRRGARRRTGRT
jgi:acyl carrier protein